MLQDNKITQEPELPETGIDFSTEMNFWMSCERNLLSRYALKSNRGQKN